MRLDRAVWETRDGLPGLLAALGAGAGNTRLVGGVVRDGLLRLPVADIDLATRLTPEVLARLRDAGVKSVPTGIAHGTVTAVLPSGPIEVTTLRRDLATDGRRAEVAFTDDWREDAARRDFTINALSADPRSGEVHDYFGGLADLAAPTRVRFIGDPLVRIAEDHLRILRFFRFHARFGEGPPDLGGLAACAARANDLMALSRERIAQELLRLLALPRAAETLAVMLEQAILAPVVPEIGGAGLARLRRLRANEAAAGLVGDAVRALAAALGPDPVVADAVAARLRLSNAQRKRLALALHPVEPDPPLIRARAYRDGVVAATDQLLLSDLPEKTVAAALARLADWQPPRLPIGGAKLIALGIAPGKAVAAALARIEGRWLAESFPDAARVEEIAAEEAGHS